MAASWGVGIDVRLQRTVSVVVEQEVCYIIYKNILVDSWYL